MAPRIRSSVVLVFTTLLLVRARSSAQPFGAAVTEIRVSTSFLAADSAPVVAFGGGGFVVAWGLAPFLGSTDIRARRYSTKGAPLDDSFRVNTFSTYAQSLPAITPYASGFMIVWQSVLQDGDQEGVYGRRFSATGVPVGVELRANVTTAGEQKFPRVTSTGGEDNFLVVWEDGALDGSSSGVYLRRFNDGAPLGGAFRVNTTTAGAQGAPDVSFRPGGPTYYVAWQGAGATDADGIYAKRIDPNTGPLGGEFRVNSVTAGAQVNPAIAAGVARFIVIWESPNGAGGLDVFGRQIDEEGAPFGAEFRVNTHTTGDQWNARLAIHLSTGNFLIVWQDDRDGSDDIYGKRFLASGAQVGNEFRVNTYATGDQGSPDVASLGSGNYVVAWDSNEQAGIFVQLLCGLAGDADGNNAVTVSDILYLVNNLFAGGPPPLHASDVNGNGGVDVTDILYLINFLFAGGAAPVCAV